MSVTLAVVLVLTVLTGAGYFYMWHEVGGLVQGVTGSESKITDLKNSVLYYTLFMALVIFGSVTFVASAATKQLRDRNIRLEDKLNLQDSTIDDLKTQLVAFEDRIKLKEVETGKQQQVTDGSIVDKATGLFNQNYFHDILPIEINRAKRDKKQLVLVLIDIPAVKSDPKKRIEYATELKKCAKRAGDFSFRFDNDRFGVIFSGLSQENSRRFVDFIKESLQGEGSTLSAMMGVTFSFGESLPESDALYTQTEAALSRATPVEPIVYEIIE